MLCFTKKKRIYGFTDLKNQILHTLEYFKNNSVNSSFLVL